MKKLLKYNWMTMLVMSVFLISGGCSQAQQEGVKKADKSPFVYDQNAITDKKPWTSENFRNNPENFQFVIIGDRTGGANAEHTFKLAMNQINLLQPEFVINVGDLIEGYPEDMADLNGMWDEADDLLGKLDMPFFLTIGNHDVSTPETKEVYL